MQHTLLIVLAALIVVATATNCPGGSSCSGTQTCCKAKKGQYGCCPYEKAECCSDDEHCCPNGYTCDLEKQQCVQNGTRNAVAALKMLILTPQTTCPDNTSCNGSETCCKAKNGEYGCCPYANADCCADGKHCCPNGYTCDLKKQECVKNGISNAMGVIRMAAPQTDCPGGSSCNGSETCCKAKNGEYGCCPYANADCCADGKHCCPNGYACDLKKQECVKNGSSNAMGVIRMAAPQTACPGGSSCNGSETCCKAKNGEYGCCPYANADCCADGKHCCPNGYTCDLKKQECVKNGSTEAISFASIRTRPMPVIRPANNK